MSECVRVCAWVQRCGGCMCLWKQVQTFYKLHLFTESWIQWLYIKSFKDMQNWLRSCCVDDLEVRSREVLQAPGVGEEVLTNGWTWLLSSRTRFEQPSWDVLLNTRFKPLRGLAHIPIAAPALIQIDNIRHREGGQTIFCSGIKHWLGNGTYFCLACRRRVLHDLLDFPFRLCWDPESFPGSP